jgi:hypothetical protein
MLELYFFLGIAIGFVLGILFVCYVLLGRGRYRR